MTITIPAAAHPTATAPTLPTRDELVDLLDALLTHELPGAGLRAAWQGAVDASDSWRRATGPDDLDVWADEDAADRIDAVLRALPAAIVQHADDPRRLRHTSYAVETGHGLAVIDVTRGDLRVGPVLLVPTAEVGVSDARLIGAAAAADNLVRPLLRGKVPSDPRLAQARAGWAEADIDARAALERRLDAQLGSVGRTAVAALRSTTRIDRSLATAARRALLRVTLAPRHLPAAWAQRHVVLPARRGAGPLGLRTRGALVVLVGTDGSGKSTVAAEVEERLTALGLRTRTAHLGMARGNLPGVATARRLLGVAPSSSAQGEAPAVGSDLPPTADVPLATDTHAGLVAASPTLSHASLRRAAAWFYAAEYGMRWLRDVAPGTRRGGVVLADRYVYDLRETPWPGSRASAVAERLLPRPAVLVLPDAPADLIHARKPERPMAEQRDQQVRFRALLAERPARVAQLVVDTSGTAGHDTVAPVVAAVVEALHRF